MPISATCSLCAPPAPPMLACAPSMLARALPLLPRAPAPLARALHQSFPPLLLSCAPSMLPRAPLAILFMLPLKRPCSLFQLKTAVGNPRFGVYIIYILYTPELRDLPILFEKESRAILKEAAKKHGRAKGSIKE